MERVLIVAKTFMYDGKCVSGLALDGNRGRRLLTALGQQQPHDTPFEIGQLWDIEWKPVFGSMLPPHVEDVRVLKMNYVSTVVALRSILLQRIQPWCGAPNQLYDGYITVSRSKAYICRSVGLPSRSTGYWLPDKPLTLQRQHERSYYAIDYDFVQDGKRCEGTLCIPYVGCMEPLPKIPAQTLLRVSLARWWKKTDAEEKKCYLQLSGWYL